MVIEGRSWWGAKRRTGKGTLVSEVTSPGGKNLSANCDFTVGRSKIQCDQREANGHTRACSPGGTCLPTAPYAMVEETIVRGELRTYVARNNNILRPNSWGEKSFLTTQGVVRQGEGYVVYSSVTKNKRNGCSDKDPE